MARPTAIGAIAALLVAAPAAPVAAQSSVRGTVRIEIGPVVQVHVAPSAAASSETRGEYTVMDRAVHVRVSANTPWRLTVATLAADRSTASLSAAPGIVARPLWVRSAPGSIRQPDSASPDGMRLSSEGYLPVTGRGSVVAEGEPGRDRELVLDYRWLSGDGDPEPPELVFDVSPR